MCIEPAPYSRVRLARTLRTPQACRPRALPNYVFTSSTSRAAPQTSPRMPEAVGTLSSPGRIGLIGSHSSTWVPNPGLLWIVRSATKLPRQAMSHRQTQPVPLPTPFVEERFRPPELALLRPATNASVRNGQPDIVTALQSRGWCAHAFAGDRGLRTFPRRPAWRIPGVHAEIERAISSWFRIDLGGRQVVRSFNNDTDLRPCRAGESRSAIPCTGSGCQLL